MVTCKEVAGLWDQLFERNYMKPRIMAISERYPEVSSIRVSYTELDASDLIDPLWESSREVLDCGRDVLMHHVLDLRMDNKPPVEPNTLFIRPENGSINPRISDIRSWHRGKLLEFDGIVRRCGEVRYIPVKIAYRCQRCEHEFSVDACVSTLSCPGCERAGPFKRVIERSVFVNSQRLVIQEPYETGDDKIREPKSIDVVISGDMVDVVRPGEHVRAVGILDLVPVKRDRDHSNPEFRPRLDCRYIETLGSDYRDIEISDADEARIRELAADPDIISILVRSTAPTILGHKNVKLGLLIQQVGGNTIEYKDGTTSRGTVHVLLVGDPSLGKSILLSFVSRLAPRCARSAGGGASGVGVTASVVRERDEWVLEAGVLPLASGGIAIIVEFDKLGDEDRAMMHEALEEGVIHVDKASIHAVLPARCSLLAAANPKLGRFDPYTPVVEQLNLTPALLSRFDLIFTLIDKPDSFRDRDIAGHVLSGARYAEPPLDIAFLRKYLAYARRLRPRMDDACLERLGNYYVSTRGSGSSSFTILPRALQTLRRLAEACAKLRLSEVADANDAEMAILVYESAFRPLISSDSGVLDVDTIELGISSKERDRIHAVMRIIQDLSQNGGARLQSITSKAGELGIAEADAMKIIARLKKYGDIIEPQPGIFRTSHR